MGLIMDFLRVPPLDSSERVNRLTGLFSTKCFLLTFDTQNGIMIQYADEKCLCRHVFIMRRNEQRAVSSKCRKGPAGRDNVPSSRALVTSHSEISNSDRPASTSRPARL